MPSTVPAVVLGHDHILRHVDQDAASGSRIGCLERRVGQTLACAVRRDEVFEHGQPFAEVRGDGRLMTSPEGLAISPRMPESWRICCFDPRAPESAMM